MPRRSFPSRKCGHLPQANHTEGAPFLRVLCARVGPETDRTTGFWLAQRRGPQPARFWRAGVERFTAAITGLFSSTALAAEVTLFARERVFPQAVRGWASRIDFFRSLLTPIFLERPRRRFFIVEHFKNSEQLGNLEKLTYALA